MKGINISIILMLTIGIHEILGDVTSDNVANAVNEFTLRLYKELIKTNENLFSSGFSVSTVLNMLLAGANTTTQTELMSVLGYTSRGLTETDALNTYHNILMDQRGQQKSYELDMGNSMWIQDGFNVLPQYKETVKKLFFAEEREVVFGPQSTTDEINNWVKKETKGKIPTLFDSPLGSDEVMVLVNALYFKGLWKNKFDQKLTEDYPFIYKGTVSRKLRMMNIIHKFPYTESSDLDAHILELPYAGNDVSMFVVLPTAIDGVSNLESNLTIAKLNAALRLMTEETVHVKLPKFAESSRLPLSSDLQSLGITTAFDPQNADLSGINGQRNLYVSNVIQKAIIEVNEEGTVAAAATGAEVKATSVAADSKKEYYFVADHPFLYFIKHKPTNVILFMGKFCRGVRHPNDNLAGAE